MGRIVERIAGRGWGRMVAWAVALGVGHGVALGQQDKIRSTPTGWAWEYGATSAAIDANLAGGLRPFAFSRIGTDQYDTCYVSNAGVYEVSGADVLYGLEESSLILSLALGGDRIIDLEAYDTILGVRFGAIVVPNAGATQVSSWDWAHGLTWAQVGAWLAARPTLRPIDIDAYVTSGQLRYSVVAVVNAGVNAVADWWIGTGAGADTVRAAMVANDARLVDIEVVDEPPQFGGAKYAYIMIPRGEERSDWFTEVRSEDLASLVSQVGSRVVCLERYSIGVVTRYSVVTVDNLDAQSGRMRDYIMGDDRGLASTSNIDGGTMGFLLKEVGGPVLASLQADLVWEPASTVKLLHAVYALWQCSMWVDALDANVQYRNLNNVSQIMSGCTSCAFDWFCGPVNIRLDETIRYLLEPSSNTALIALERRYNVGDINAFADARGFGAIEVLRQDCACAEVLNTATCEAVCEMMEQVAEGSIFAAPWREVLFTLMNDVEEQGYGLYPTLAGVIAGEAAQTDLTTEEVAQFREQMRFANKGGSYDCGTFWRTEGGWASVPFKENVGGQWVVAPREYVFALYIDDTSRYEASNIVYAAKEEILREQIREALESWDASCVTPFVLFQPDSVLRAEGTDAEFDAIVAGGGEGGAYRWQREIGPGVWGSLIDAPGSIEGADTNTLRLIAVDPGDAGKYRLRYTSVCGETTSLPATLAVLPGGACDGDVNGDDSVNAADFVILASNFGMASGAVRSDGDLNGDGAVNASDFVILAANFGSSCP